MIGKVWLCGCLMVTLLQAQSSEEEPLRFWKDIKGREIIGELVASDGIRVTLRIEDNSKKVFPLNFFSAADRKFVSSWRDENPQAPWIDPQTMPAWPQKIGKGLVEVRQLASADDEFSYSYRSRHFEMLSDVELPLPLVRDMATIFETTRLVVHALPLGLAASPPVPLMQIRLQQKYPQLKYDPKLLRVQLYGNAQSFAQSGAPAGSGGFYHTLQNRTLLSLENLGIKGREGLSRIDFMKSDFVLKHEITHHLLHDWFPYLPVWFQEGFAEYMGAAPYSQGRYQFVTMDRDLHKYLNRWRFDEDPNRLPIMKMAELMTSSREDWSARLLRTTPILEYNSAAMLVHFFIHHDGKGDASHLAAYLNDIRLGISPAEAEKVHLLRGRSYEQIDEELQRVWKQQRITLERVGEVDPFE